MSKWNKNKKDCRNCQHFYVCAYHKEWKISGFLGKHLGDCLEMDDMKAQKKSREICYKLFSKYCKYFNQNAYSNTFVNSTKPSYKTEGKNEN